MGNLPRWGGKGSGERFSSYLSALTLALQIHKLLGFSGATQSRLSKPCGFTLGVLHMCFTDYLEGKLCCLLAEGQSFFGEVWSCNMGTSISFCVCFLGEAPVELFSSE